MHWIDYDGIAAELGTTRATAKLRVRRYLQAHTLEPSDDGSAIVVKSPARQPAPDSVAQPAPDSVAQPAPDAVAQPAPDSVAQPAPDSVAEPAPDSVAPPAPDSDAQPRRDPHAARKVQRAAARASLTCRQCGKPLNAERPTARFCGPTCRSQMWRTARATRSR